MIATIPASLFAAIPLAIAAGLVSFVSPCVLPLLPGYVAFLTGATGRIEGQSGKGRALIGSIAFILGFAIVFVSVGALFGDFGAHLKTHERILEIVFGVMTIATGSLLRRTVALVVAQPRASYPLRATGLGVGAVALGFTFGLGWTPCIGPTLGTILGLETSSVGATALRGSILAFFYCAGLGIPFIVAALATEWMATASKWLRMHEDHRPRGRPVAGRHRRVRDDGVVAGLRLVASDPRPGNRDVVAP